MGQVVGVFGKILFQEGGVKMRMKTHKVLLLMLFFLTLVTSVLFANGTTSSLQVSLPPGGFYAFYYNESSGLIPLTSSGTALLPSCAANALEIAPPAWKDKLAETFYVLMTADINVEENSFPAFADLNGDGLTDMIVGSHSDGIEIFYNAGITSPVWLKQNTSVFFDVTPSSTDLAVELGDINKDGLVDLVTLDSSGKILFFVNKGTKNQPYWVLLDYTIEKLVKNGVPRLIDLNNDEREDLIVGGGNDQIYFYTNEATSTMEGFEFVAEDHGKTGYSGLFSKWPRPDGTTGIMIGNKLAPAFGDLNGDGLPDMIVGNENGNLFYFENIGTEGKPVWKQVNIPTISNIKVSGRAVPYIINLNGDLRPDLVIGSSDGKVYYALNVGSAFSPAFRVWKSNAEKTWLAEYLWGSAYWKDLNSFTYLDQNNKYVIDYAKLILSTEPKYIDEVSYIIANAFPKDLKSMDDKGFIEFYRRIPAAIYKIAPELKYVKLVEEEPYTTLQYKTKDGNWTTLPRDIYYRYVVMPNRYTMRPSYYPKENKGYLFNEYLPYDKTYGKSLLDIVKDSATVNEAVYAIAKWIAVDIGAVWHTGPKPKGWYKIYHNLLNEKAGIWCGEFSIIIEAMARSVLIPTTIVLSLGEDHQFNQFYDNGWNHWDQSSMNKENWETYIGNENLPKTWYGGVGDKRAFSWPMSWEQNGRYDYVHHTSLLYKPEDLTACLNIKVTDANGLPIDGAQIVLWSHWALKSDYDSMPFPAAITYTDQNGEAKIDHLAFRAYSISIVTPIGVKYITTTLNKHAVYNFSVKMDDVLPICKPNCETPVSPVAKTKLNVNVLCALQKTVNWLYTGGTIYREFSSGKVKVYIMDRINYEKFLKGEKFEAYSVSNMQSGTLELPENAYVVLSNLESAHTYVKVGVTLEH